MCHNEYKTDTFGVTENISAYLYIYKKICLLNICSMSYYFLFKPKPLTGFTLWTIYSHICGKI